MMHDYSYNSYGWQFTRSPITHLLQIQRNNTIPMDVALCKDHRTPYRILHNTKTVTVHAGWFCDNGHSKQTKWNHCMSQFMALLFDCAYFFFVISLSLRFIPFHSKSLWIYLHLMIQTPNHKVKERHEKKNKSKNEKEKEKSANLMRAVISWVWRG